jgi:Amt family ammonium transporter
VATHFAAAGAALSWMAAEWMIEGRPSALGGISGAVAGLVAITPASGFVDPMSALLIGLLAGAFCFFMVTKVKKWFGYDDSLDAFGVHGAGGTLGAILTGVFATRYVNPIFKDVQGNATGSGLIDGNAHQLLNQATGVLIAWILAAVGTLVLLKVVDLTVGLRVKEEAEVQGLDLALHGEEGYSLE